MRAFQRSMLRPIAWLICLALVHSFSDAQSTTDKMGSLVEAIPSDGNHAGRALHASSTKLKVCIITADFWGMLKSDSGRGVRAMLKGGGGTATASHLLANTLKEQDFLQVTFLGVTKDIDVCTQAQKVTWQLHLSSR